MILKIIGLTVAWFIAGAVINYISYDGKPAHERGKSETAKTLHILLNIATVIGIILIIIN